MDEPLLVFLDLLELNDQSIRGAALVTDASTEPVEFRCTSPIRPTALQRTLWGKRLEGHIACHLVGKPLLDALSNRPQLIVSRKPEFVALRSLVPLPLVQVLRNEELALASSLADGDGREDMLAPSSAGFEPVIVKVHRRFVEDRDLARRLLNDAFQNHSVLEPFERITNALELVHQQDRARKE